MVVTELRPAKTLEIPFSCHSCKLEFAPTPTRPSEPQKRPSGARTALEVIKFEFSDPHNTICEVLFILPD